MPERSTLFQLSPIATGTALVEGLSRYLNRLATEHSLSVSDLIELDIFPLSPSADEDRRVRRRLFHASCYLMDGSRSHTEPWIYALELATMQKGLHKLTLLPYSRLCDDSWLRRNRAWCPHCLEDWHQVGSTIYESLIWSMKVTYMCPFHRVALEYNCRSCGRSSTPLAGRSRPGYCAWCLDWLGRLKGDREQASDPYELWSSNQAAAFVAAMGKIPSLLSGDAIAQAMARLLGSKIESSRSSIAEYTGCTRRSISTWVEGTTRPRVESFFRLCYALDTTPLKLLGYDERETVNDHVYEPSTRTDNDFHLSILSPKKPTGRPPKKQRIPVGSQSRPRDSFGLERLRHAPELAVEAEKYVSPRQIAQQLGFPSPDRALGNFPNLLTVLNARRTSETKGRRVQIRGRLQKAILEWPPPTLKSIAKELNMSSSTALRSIEPRFCKRILDRHELWKREKLKAIRALIETEIEAVEMVSLRRFCRRVDLSLSLVTSEFAELKVRYVQRYKSIRELQRLGRDEEFQKEVKIAVEVLRARGEFPSAGNVLLLKPTLSHGGWDKMQRAIQVAVKSATNS
jgi:transcriptional regulator with XRE-family HTH domain